MKSITPVTRRPGLAAAAVAALLCAGGAAAAPSYQASDDPVFVGGSFTMVLRDGAVDPALGFGSFDVRVNFDPAVLGQPAGTAGSAFGNAGLGFTYDVLDGGSGFGSDGIDDAGWARYTITRNAGAQPSSFGAEILRLDFRVVGLPLLGPPVADITYFAEPALSPEQYAFGSADTFTARIGVLAVVPEPATAALLLAGFGLLCGTRRGAGRGGDATREPPPAAA